MQLVPDSLAANLVDGQWVEPSAGRTIEVANPANLEVIGRVPDRDPSEAALAAAAAGRAAPGWAATPAVEREAVLMRAADLMVEHREALAHLITLEQGKPLEESRGEIDYGVSFVRWYAAEARRLYGEIVPAQDPAKVPARLPRAGRADPPRQLRQRPLRDDHPQGRAGPRRGLPPRRQAPPRDPVQRPRRRAALRGGGPASRRHERHHHHPLRRILPDPPRAPRDAARHVHRVVGRRPASRRSGGRAHEGHDHGARRARTLRGPRRRGPRPRSR